IAAAAAAESCRMPPMTTLEDQISALASRVHDLEARLTRLEGRAPMPVRSDSMDINRGTLEAATMAEAVSAGRLDGTRLTTALGRSFIILGGAFLLRALTDAGTVPPAVGVG